MIYYIYTLSCPSTREVRYIGKTNDLSKRLSAHCKDKIKSHKTSWIKSLASRPLIEILEETDDEEYSYELEGYWIAQFRELGFNLTNLTIGNIKYGKSWTHLTAGEPILPNDKHHQKNSTKENRAIALRAKGVYDKLSVMVEQYNTNNQLVGSYKSISEAARVTNTNRSSIAQCLKNKLKSANNFIWKRK